MERARKLGIIEHVDCPPGSNLLQAHMGETCGSVFWALLNQRLHWLEPDEEKYVVEIEKSIYNVLLANQDGAHGIRYHTRLVGQKDAPTRKNTCCEGQGTRLLASLPQFIYSRTDDGLSINLFAPSQIAWTQCGVPMRLTMQTQFPYGFEVRLHVHAEAPVWAKTRVRVPAWAAGAFRADRSAGRSVGASDLGISDRVSTLFRDPGGVLQLLSGHRGQGESVLTQVSRAARQGWQL